MCFTSVSNEIDDTPRKYSSISFVRCEFIGAFLVLQEKRELKIHSEVSFTSELAEAVPAERESISFEERVWKFVLMHSLYKLCYKLRSLEKAYKKDRAIFPVFLTILGIVFDQLWIMLFCHP